MHYELGGYKPADIDIAAAFDIDRRKVGRPPKEAVFANQTAQKVFNQGDSDYPVTLQMGEILDGISQHIKDYPEERRFIAAADKTV